MFSRRVFWLIILFFACGFSSILAQAQTKNFTERIRSLYNLDSFEKQGVDFEKTYMQLLYEASDSQFEAEFEPEFKLLLSVRQKDYYESLTSSLERKDFITQFWQAHDPNPLLAQNDRLLSHLLRVAYVRKNFSTPKHPFFDDRGLYYIKYGEPSVRYTDPGGIRRIAFFTPDNYDRITSAYYTYKNGPQRMYSVPSNESWAYENISSNFVVHFVSKGAVFREVASLSEIIPVRRRANMAWQWSDLIKKRASISPALSETAADINLFETEALIGGNELATGNRLSNGSAHRKIIESLEVRDKELVRSRRDVPATSYQPLFAKSRIRFSATTAQFRGAGNNTRVEVNYYVPVQANFPMDFESQYTLSLEYGGMLRNRVFTPLANTRATRRSPISSVKQESTPFLAETIVLESAAQTAELTLQVKDDSLGFVGFSKSNLEIRSFESKDLAVSDIQYYSEPENEIEQNFLPQIEKQGLQLIPYPELKISKARPFFCYFEVYNLKAAGIEDAFQISYRISTATKDGGFLQKMSKLLSRSKQSSISLSLEQQVDQDYSEEVILIDLSNLENGWHVLEITVSDPKNSSIKATTKRGLTIKN